MKLRLYHYWRSSAAWRVRWAMALKKIPPQDIEFVPIDLLKGEQKSPEHLARNPMGAVPVLELLDVPAAKPRFVTESMAIIEWLEETYPQPSLFPKDSVLRAQTRALALEIIAGTHPLQNMRVLKFYSDDPAKQDQWATHWIGHGIGVYDKLVAPSTGRFSVGDTVTMADICLIPQCYNALRRKMDLGQFPNVKRIYDNALKTSECIAASPEKFEPKP